MKLFFEICKEFFELLYLPAVSDIIENEIIKDEFHNELDEEKGYQEVSPFIEDNKENEEYEYIQNEERENNQIVPNIPDIQYKQEMKKDVDEKIVQHEEEPDDEFCGYELFMHVISFINARIFKKINDNKNE